MGPAVDFFLHAAALRSRRAGAETKLAGPKRPFLPPTGGSSTAQGRAGSPHSTLAASAPTTRKGHSSATSGSAPPRATRGETYADARAPPSAPVGSSWL